MAFILGMCITLPLTLLPQRLMLKFRLIDRVQSETMALWTGQTCAIWMLRLFPFCDITCFPHYETNPPKPSIWVCNHTSMLDVFVLLAMDRKLRGKNKRPIKIVYVSYNVCVHMNRNGSLHWVVIHAVGHVVIKQLTHQLNSLLLYLYNTCTTIH